MKTTIETDQRVTCDECGEPFTISVIVLRVMGRGEKQVFDCPHCQKRYSGGWVSDRGIAYREELKRERELLHTDASEEAVAERWDRIESLQRKLAAETRR